MERLEKRRGHVSWVYSGYSFEMSESILDVNNAREREKERGGRVSVFGYEKGR